VTTLEKRENAKPVVSMLQDADEKTVKAASPVGR
jgi:hypothetical protein